MTQSSLSDHADGFSHGAVDQKVRGSNPFERAEVSRSNTGKLVRYSSIQSRASSHSSSHSGSQVQILLLEKSAIHPSCHLVHVEISWKCDRLSAHGEVCVRKYGFGLSGYAGRAGKCAVVKRHSFRTHLMREQHLYTIAQACAKLAISRASLYRLINNHEIACIKIGRSSRISEQALERFVSARTKAVYDAWS